MANFDFITHDDLRKSLESDYQELYAAMETQSYKSVHVLAGSIIEAVLVEHLLFADYKSRTGKDPLNMMLDKLIESCKNENIISQRIMDLSTVIRSYRNLIHPARLIRLNERVDANGAKVAQALVEMILEEVAEKRRSSYGYTAKQIIEKLEKDPSIKAVLEEILKQTNKIELEKLLVAIPEIPVEDVIHDPEYWINFSDVIEECYYMAFSMADDDIKSRISMIFAKVIREGSERDLNAYGNTFFKAIHMEYLPEDDRKIVKKHILHRFPSIVSSGCNLLKGIGNYISEKDVLGVIDPTIRATISRNKAEGARIFLEREYPNMSKEIQDLVLGRLDDWIRYYQDKGSEAYLNRIEELKQQLVFSDEDIPF